VEYEPETEALPLLLRPGAVCVDVGGNFGQFAAFLSRAVGPTGQVHSFEPLPYNQKIFTAVMRYLRASNVQLHCCALGSENGTGRLVVPDLNTGEAYMAPSFNGVEVEVLRLDDWAGCAQIGAVDFIKIDVEGFELFVLRGARHLIESCHPVILCEISNTSRERFGVAPEEVFGFLSGIGYASYVWRNHKMVPCRAPDVTTANFLFVPRWSGVAAQVCDSANSSTRPEKYCDFWRRLRK
jgi:FkbM family methyltransferase